MSAYQKYKEEAKQRRKLILRLSRKGVAPAEIARQAGVTRQRVVQVVKEAEAAK